MFSWFIIIIIIIITPTGSCSVNATWLAQLSLFFIFFVSIPYVWALIYAKSTIEIYRQPEGAVAQNSLVNWNTPYLPL
jgi:hypothetical protein